MEEKHVDYWSESDDSEYLYQEEEDECIYEILDNMVKPLPDTITIYGWARKELQEVDLLSLHPLSDVLESLDDEYGSPDDAYDPTPAMIEAEKAFLDVITKEYSPWVCEAVIEKEINVQEWIKENKPDWLEDDPWAHDPDDDFKGMYGTSKPSDSAVETNEAGAK